MRLAQGLVLAIISVCSAALAEEKPAPPAGTPAAPPAPTGTTPAPIVATLPEGPGSDPNWRAYSPRIKPDSKHDTFTLDRDAKGFDRAYYEGSWACQTTNCTDLSHCVISNAWDSQAYACQSWKAGKKCVDALSSDAPRLDDNDKLRLRNFYRHVDASADCHEMGPWEKAWTSTAVYVSKGYPGPGWTWRHGLKILPTVSLGVPVSRAGNDDTRKALRGLSALGGLTVRYSPVAFVVSLHAFGGTSTVSTEDLNPEIYKAPALLVGGFGIDFADGLFGVSILWANLRRNGLSDDPGGTARSLQLSIDLTSAVLSVVQQKK